jgi:hypothetical protein
MQDHVLSIGGDALIPAKMEHPSLSRTEVDLPPYLPPSLEQKFICLLISFSLLPESRLSLALLPGFIFEFHRFRSHYSYVPRV